jgi:hypothetical protein
MRNSLDKILIVCFFIFIGGCNLLAAQNMSAHYREAYRLEQIRTYHKARKEYLNICKNFIARYDKAQDKKLLLGDVPLAIGAVVRLSVVTGKDNYANLYQLVSQMNSYKETHKIIEKMLNIIVEYRLKNRAYVSEYVLGEVLFARAYNRIGWANKLLISIPWKNYIVFPLSDLLGMVDVAIKDLKQLLLYDGISYSDAVNISSRGLLINRDTEKLYLAYYDLFNNRIEVINHSSLDYKIFQKIYFKSEASSLSSVMAEKRSYQAFKLVDYYYSDFVKGVLKRARRYHDMESIIGAKNRDVFQVLDEMVSIMGISQKNGF